MPLALIAGLAAVAAYLYSKRTPAPTTAQTAVLNQPRPTPAMPQPTSANVGLPPPQRAEVTTEAQFTPPPPAPMPAAVVPITGSGWGIPLPQTKTAPAGHDAIADEPLQNGTANQAIGGIGNFSGGQGLSHSAPPATAPLTGTGWNGAGSAAAQTAQKKAIADDLMSWNAGIMIKSKYQGLLSPQQFRMALSYGLQPQAAQDLVNTFYPSGPGLLRVIVPTGGTSVYMDHPKETYSIS
jgi:hypothetical protein